MASKRNLNDVAAEVGADKVACTCGRRIDGTKGLKDFFNHILGICKDGGEVRIKNFGTFRAKVHKGRKVISPALGGSGEAEFDDSLVLRFHQAGGAKRILNEGNKTAEKVSNNSKGRV